MQFLLGSLEVKCGMTNRSNQDDFAKSTFYFEISL